jgi:ribosomal protein S18 acetylase RimI-like enzyme
MDGIIRGAEPRDLAAIVALAEEKRAWYERFQPTFWRPAADARERHTRFLQQLVESGRVIALVHERDGLVDGFVIAQLAPAPPIYDPGGPACSIEDFWVAGGTDWEGAGRTLLDEALRQAKARGAVQSIVICGHLDQAKRAMLAASGFAIASEWYVRDI